MEVIIDGSQLNKQKELHETIARQLELPDYYGENLDALWDVLTEQTAPMKITIRHGERFLRQLGAYGETVLELLQEAEEANENITVEIEL